MGVSNPVKALEKAGQLHLEGRYAEAERLYLRLHRDHPSDPEILRLLGVVYSQQGRPHDGLRYAREAVLAAPRYAEAHICLAQTLEGCGLYDECIEVATEAVEMLNQEMLVGRRDEEDAKEKAATARFSRSIALLAKGDYIRGFRDYEAGRYFGARQGPMGKDRTSPYEKWRGGRLEGRSHLVVVWEQGYGDVIAFSRFLPKVCERAACRVTFAVQEAMVPLFETQNRDYDVVRATKGDVLPDHTHYANLLSIPYLLGTDREGVVGQPYLTAGRLVLPEGLHVGVCWGGSPGHIDNARRNMTPQLLENVKAWAPKATVHSLQYGQTDFKMDTMFDTAIAVNSMDLVVTTCTSIAHLAGALGKPTWLMLSKPHYWMWSARKPFCGFSRGDQSVWYPSVTYFEQNTRGDWGMPLQYLKRRLSIYPEELT